MAESNADPAPASGRAAEAPPQTKKDALAALQAALALAEQRRIEAERANAAKSRFLAHMSHEIRTPLNGVLGLTELALRVAESPEQRRFLETAHQAGQALLRMINDVLDLSRIESGETELRPRDFEPTEVLADAMRTLMPLARQRDLLLVFDWVGEVPWVHGDDGALRQIAINLLGNAIKFTERGQVTLTTSAPMLADGRVQLTVTVADTGPGVPPPRRADIFKAFVQGDDSLARGHGGAGLGLAIAARLTEAMGGRLELDCPPAGGSVFTLSVPLPAAPAPAGSCPELRESPGRIWLIYGRPPGGTWLAANLTRQGWLPVVIYGLCAAVAHAQSVPAPDAVVVTGQVLVPGADLAPLRAALPQTPVRLVVRPEWHDQDIEAQAQALQLPLHLAPVTPAMLRCLLAPDAAQAAPREAPPPQWRDGAQVLLVEDNPVNQLVGAEFLRALGLGVRVAADGAAAVACCLDVAPDLVLMDLQMPGVDGLEATRRLRALQREGRWRGAPILALTANATAADRADCFAAGMDGVLVKPLSLRTLREALTPWLGA